MDYLISDTHFHHANIIKYTDRPFMNTAEMNETIIKNWNKIVKPNDRVFHLGDVFFCSQDEAYKIKSKLNGQVILLKGNHDKHSKEWYKQIGFSEVYDKPFILHNKYIMSHYPLEVDLGSFINIHGHVHNRSLELHNYVNVSVEAIHYTPVLFDEIRKLFESDKSK
jgi:calcineurin-like phosphoesterase family protein